MNDINYIGEWLLAGNFGHLLTILNMVAAFVALIAFWSAARCQHTDLVASQSWRNLARKAFYINALSIVGIFVTLFLLIFNHRFEFKYVWSHSSVDLPVYYMISCFWEGQEGSFLLWSFWTAVLGLVVIWRAKKWESSVMTFVSFMQIFLAAMLIGIYFFGYKIGSSPFLLLRHDTPDLPIFMNANYVNLITDGNGLNPLLQNYWMVIHPPTLFLGFAACLMPFAYVMAGLWQRNFDKTWTQATLIWSLFAGGVLGTGILMGGAWAYEALSFGGFWAWDPVENASLVPWIVLIGGIHTLLAYKHSQHALRPTAIMLSMTFLLILYSTFLTRSGILGDTSVHAFTDLGMSGQLLVFMLSFVGLAIILMAYGWSAMPSPDKEESAYSREFWMFVGSIIMLMLAILVTIDTSWPVINKVFGTDKVITEPVEHYNRYAIYFGIVLALMSATVQYFRYKTTGFSSFLKKISFSIILSIALTVLLAIQLKFNWWMYNVLLFSALYVIVANLSYLLAVLKGKVKVAGASVAHIGFGLILLGILISSAKKETISLNQLNIDYGEEFEEKDKRENVLLYKGKPIQMNEYWVTYLGDTIMKPNTYHKVFYEKKDKQTDIATETFTLYPNSQVNPKMGLIANPDTRHYWTKDIFTHVSSIADKTKQAESASYKEVELEIGKELRLDTQNLLFLRKINTNPLSATYLPLPDDVAAGAVLEVLSMNGETFKAEPIYFIRDNKEQNIDVVIEELGLTFSFDKILPEKNSIKLGITKQQESKEFIIMKAIVFPYINVLWLGSFVMLIGFILSVLQRRKEGRRFHKKSPTIETK